MKDFTIECCKEAGKLLLEHFGKTNPSNTKENISNIVTEADIASEKLIISMIKDFYPKDAIIGEESGYQKGRTEYTWVIDPLDGTSNFAAGLPWFGVLLTRLKGNKPVFGIMHVPLEDTTYWAELGSGAYRNGEKIAVSQETELSNVLWAYGMDATKNEEATEREVRTLALIKNTVRNVRATNSIIDGCCTADGRFGGLLNQCVKIWDIAGTALIIQEAGGVVTDLKGTELELDLDNYLKEYGVVCGASILHSKILELISRA